MTLNALRLILFVGLLLVGNISYADEKTKTSKEANGSKVSNNESTSEGKSGYRTPPAFPQSHVDSNPPPNPYEERIKRLEKIIQDQQKLIEMYRKQNNQNNH
jgi:hypothetical protein